MKALLFGARPDRNEKRPVPTDELEARLAALPGADHRRLQCIPMEELDGVRKHAIAHYLDLVQAGRIDLTSMITHRYPLEDWWDALKALARPGDSGVLKATFAPNGTPA